MIKYSLSGMWIDISVGLDEDGHPIEPIRFISKPAEWITGDIYKVEFDSMDSVVNSYVVRLDDSVEITAII